MIKRTLYFGSSAYLKKQHDQLVIESPGRLDETGRKTTRSIPIEDIGIIVLDHPQITITQGLVDRLMVNKCVLINCNSSHIPNAIMLPLDGHEVQTERFRFQIGVSEPLKKNLWQQTVISKIMNQGRVLEVSGRIAAPLYKWANQVRSGDPGNIEAKAAYYYWQHLFDDRIDFSRNADDDSINSLLNYGYAILRAIVARALVTAGLHPTLGIFHSNRYNSYCLADDIMEPYRPFVDILVLELGNQYNPVESLTRELKGKLLQIGTLDVLLDSKNCPLMLGVQRTVHSLVLCYAGELRKIKYPALPAPVKI